MIDEDKRRQEPVYQCLKKVDEFLHALTNHSVIGARAEELHAEVHEACHAYVNLPYPTESTKRKRQDTDALRRVLTEPFSMKYGNHLWLDSYIVDQAVERIVGLATPAEPFEVSVAVDAILLTSKEEIDHLTRERDEALAVLALIEEETSEDHCPLCDQGRKHDEPHRDWCKLANILGLPTEKG